MSTTHIPTDEEVGTRTLSRWRIAEGELRKGRDADGTLETRKPNKLTGEITAFRIFDGQSQTGESYRQLEVDIRTASGMEYLKVSYNMKEGRWPTSAISLAKFLTATEEGKVYVIEPQLAKKANSFGSFNTFVDVAIWNPTAGRLDGIQTDFDGEKFNDVCDGIFEALEAHPLYKERVQEKAEADKSEYDFFVDTLQAKGFPSYEGNEAAWTEVFNAWFKAEGWEILTENLKGTVEEDDFWTYLREKTGGLSANPLLAAAPKKGPQPKKGLEKDPFAEE